ncbi:BTAD domain-containing putative transcriptional regulator [Paenibacillus albiflavus]|uniref:BTAD domain-containing putative transcriptional regulator n=1 Tax=Paenibacillus albiflavus TaxID=2545760 RepID=UPI001F2F73A8|nr:BTAD domain-containing putative transcriptional regulator [Paenibacillus albiflavus]
MNKESIILTTKLTPPTLKKYMLSRAALTKKLKSVMDYPLTLVHSGPGYGKSTALSAFLRSDQYAMCWYSPSSHDDDLVPYVTYMIYAIRTKHPKFGEEILNRMAQGEKFTLDLEIYTLCELLINAIANIDQEFVLIIDDYHVIEHSTEIDSFMQHLLRHLPSHCHLILSSRTFPKWDMLRGMKLKHDVLEIGEADLALTEEEIDVLFADYYEYSLPSDGAHQIYMRTEGWVIAIQLIWQRLLLSGGELDSVLAENTETMDELFRFLALEVFHKQSDDVRQFMLQTSILEEMTGELCDFIFARTNSQELLDYISTNHLFLLPIGDRQYRYHALFRDFLLGELKRKPKIHVELHQAAAHYFERMGKNDQAIHHLGIINDDYGVAKILQSHGRTMINHGQLESLLQRTQRISEILRNQFLMLWVYEGEIYRYRCMFDKSFSCYAKAELLASRANDVYIHSLALEGQARIYLDTIQPDKAEVLLKQAIELLEADLHADQNHLLRLYGLMAENLINSGRAAEAEEWYARCQELNGDFQDEFLEARLHLRTGRLMQAKKLLDVTREREALTNNQYLARFHRETDILLSLVELMLGNPERAKQLAESGMMQGIRQKAPFVEACGWMRMGHAAQMMPKYEFAIASDCYTTALDIMDQLDVPRGKAEPLMGLCLLYGREGMHELSMQYGNAALAETEKVNDEWLSSLIRLSMGVTTYSADRYAEASSIFMECHNRFMQCGDSYGVTVSLLWQAIIAYRQQQEALFLGFMDRFLRMMQAGEYDFLLNHRTLVGPVDTRQLLPLLIEAQRLEIQPHYVSYLLSKLGLEHMTYHPGYTLRIQTLGQFKVWLGDKELGGKDWQRDKAKEMFQLLLINRRRLVPKDEIIGLLFDSSDDKVANRDFKVALNALHTALEPARLARSNPFFIQRHGSSYGINLAAGLELDLVDFESLIKAGLEEQNAERALRYLDKGLSLYTGDFLPDRRFDDWCIEERERLQVLFLRGGERIAKLCVASKTYDTAIHWCERMLEKDPCWEEAYRLLIQCHYELGNRNQAIKWYQRCCRTITAELGIEPMKATTELYKQMMQSDVTHL